MELQGRIDKIMPMTGGVTQRGEQWKKQEFIFEFFENEDEIFSHKILLFIMNDRIDKFALNEGDEIRVSISLSSREYNGRIYNDIRTENITIVKRHDGIAPGQSVQEGDDFPI